MKQIEKFLKQLHDAEFGNEEEEIEENPKEVIKLLKRAYKWKTYDKLYEVCVYLGAESDDRADSIEGCKEIINEDIEYREAEI